MIHTRFTYDSHTIHIRFTHAGMQMIVVIDGVNIVSFFNMFDCIGIGSFIVAAIGLKTDFFNR